MYRCIFASVAVFSTTKFCMCSKKDQNLDDKMFSVVKYFQPAFVEKNLHLRRTLSDGVKIYSFKKKLQSQGNIRIIKCEINSPINEVVELWKNQNHRKRWDVTNCKESQTVRSLDSNISLNYLLTPPGYLISSRDFSYLTFKAPGGCIGSQNFMSVAFVNVDAPSEVDSSYWVVRGNLKSILLLEPIGSQRTSVTHVIEVNANGWTLSNISEYYMDRLANTISSFKKDLEIEENLEESVASIDEAAMLRFKKHHAELETVSIVEDVTANVEDLSATIVVLKAKLKDMEVSEKREGLDLAVLRHRIEKDILRIEERIKVAKK